MMGKNVWNLVPAPIGVNDTSLERERVSSLAESEELTRLRAQLAPARSTQTNAQTQKNKLQGVVVRKRKASKMEADKQEKDKRSTQVVQNKADPSARPPPGETCGAMRCVGVLPGLGHYRSDTSSDDYSDSDDSSDSESIDQCIVKRDLTRRILKLIGKGKRKKKGKNKFKTIKTLRFK